MMRRKDKEIKDQKEIISILNRAKVCRIALSDNNIPYIIPINYGYKNNYLFFHSAPEGKKINILKKNNNICFEVDIDHELIISEAACSSSMKYRSVIGLGKAEIIENFQEKKDALDIIITHYFPNFKPEYKESQVNKLSIIKIKIENMTGKKSGY